MTPPTQHTQHRNPTIEHLRYRRLSLPLAAQVFHLRAAASRALRVASRSAQGPTLDPTTRSQKPGTGQEQGGGPDKHAHQPKPNPRKPALPAWMWVGSGDEAAVVLVG